MRIATCLLATVLAVPASATESLPSLDWAFRFASSIENDDSDRAKAQQWVVGDLIEKGKLDRAIELVGDVTEWRLGVASADLAAALIRAGRAEEARPLIQRAYTVSRHAEGWRGPRITAHIAQALALLGEHDDAQKITRKLVEGDRRQYLGRGVATLAVGKAANGNVDEALAALKTIAGSTDMELVWWRTEAYLDVLAAAEAQGVSRADRERILDAAATSVRDLAGWKQAEMLLDIARLHLPKGSSKAKRLMKEAEPMVEALPEQLPAKGPLLASLARTKHELGDRKEAARLLDEAFAAVTHAQDIEKPELMARIAALGAPILAPEELRARFDEAVTLSEKLVNPRPRALAFVAVCRELDDAGISVDSELDGRFEQALTTIGEVLRP